MEPQNFSGYYFPLGETAVIQEWSFSVGLAEMSGLEKTSPAYMYTPFLFVAFSGPCNLVLFKFGLLDQFSSWEPNSERISTVLTGIAF